jgi:group I intron endonuclease
MAYVYKITNKVNNKAYIGATVTSVKSRWNRHCSDAKHNRDNQAIHAAIRKYGIDKFEIQILEQHDDSDHTFNVLEPKYIQEHNTFGENGYNMTQGGEGWLNMRHRPESIQKMRQSKIGKKATQQAKQNMSDARKGQVAWNKGKKCPQISAAKQGKLLSSEHRQALSESQQNKTTN